MLLSLCWCQLRHINYASINIATSIIGGRWWHGIWRIRIIPTRYWRSLHSCVVLREELDDFWWTNDIWVGLMNGSFNGGSVGITGDNNSLLFELMWLLSRHLLSRGLLGENLDDCWQTEDSWGGLMTELFNGRETDITGNDISMLFEWHSLRLKCRYHEESFAAYPDCSRFHFCGTSQYPYWNMEWRIKYEFVVILCDWYFICQLPS